MVSVVPLQIFLIGSFLLIRNSPEVRNVLHLSFLNTESLASIEHRHPHLPSFKIVIGANRFACFLCFVALLVSFSYLACCDFGELAVFAIFFLILRLFAFSLRADGRVAFICSLPFLQGSLLRSPFPLLLLFYTEKYRHCRNHSVCNHPLRWAAAPVSFCAAKRIAPVLRIMAGTSFVWFVVLFGAIYLRS